MTAPGETPAGPVLVVSAHAGDFVWRAGGAMALASARGADVTVLCLSYGELGESAKAWREGRQLEEIKALRREEASRAAATLGAAIEFADAGDYPLRESDDLIDSIVRSYRRVPPAVVLTRRLSDCIGSRPPIVSWLNSDKEPATRRDRCRAFGGER